MSTGSLGLSFRHKIDEQHQIYERHRRVIKEHVEGLVLVSIFLVTKKAPALRVACRAGRAPSTRSWRPCPPWVVFACGTASASAMTEAYPLTTPCRSNAVDGERGPTTDRHEMLAAISSCARC
jgi:hypothetical protein